eukprot:TRINITY_DN41012_c0_g1_i1.p3 TRINITY_DN41012_c0_g1~~TRINITY_DN41012_c0_g1_i1.p3  ORF type:complete len:150 (+),score=28.85 TRINITY_DN41012_c0_g1_i1:169-618(+)
MGLRDSLARLGLTGQLMARSLALGLVFGTIPLYVPFVPTLLLGALARLLGLSVPAALLGLQAATPFFVVLMVPFIRAGEWLGGSTPMEVAVLMSAMKEDPFGALGTFGGLLGRATLAWTCAAPVMLLVSYAVLLPICRTIAGAGEKKAE